MSFPRRNAGSSAISWPGYSTAAQADRERIRDEHPELAGLLSSMFAGLDAWNALSPDSLFPGASAEEAGAETANGHVGSEHPAGLDAGGMVVPVLDSRLAQGFQIIERVGRGGSGVVYRARLPHEVLGRPDIALKLLRDGVSLEVSKRLRDAQVLKGLGHPNLLRVYWAGHSREHGPFLATEFVEGCNLKEWLHEHGALAPESAARIVCNLASALDAAHRKQVVHCDVKPENVFGCRGECPVPDELKIGDFGLARYVAGCRVRCCGTGHRRHRRLHGAGAILGRIRRAVRHLCTGRVVSNADESMQGTSSAFPVAGAGHSASRASRWRYSPGGAVPRARAGDLPCERAAGAD